MKEKWSNVNGCKTGRDKLNGTQFKAFPLRILCVCVWVGVQGESKEVSCSLTFCR